ncbi:winged helix DNA-binding protein [Myxococcus sp. K15C18031901]|uniref:MarR family winged helix-turn-helix transcriptional regulator n=1 Tax=Myxococcus dinghuensis TaxID=2906761 RepID=UPI0020A6F438|nr:MarR family transcriptional regulator [Myxococcus dinghuensis]MCP3102709.1 winged helix DNA-binding protein [Myxococcus dinghuensis]
MARRVEDGAVRLESLDLGHLALFVGQRLNEQVLEALHAAGFAGLRQSHGYVFQHLLEGPRSISELAGLLEVTQQAASKSVAELEALGYVEKTESGDARVRHVALSPRGRACVEKSRALRTALHKRFERQHGAQAVESTRRLLARVLTSLGGAEAVTRRRVRAPR